MNNKNEVFEYLIGQLRQQVNNNQCEDLAHEVQSLKNQLRDASAQIKELNRELSVLANAFPHEPELYSCRNEDTQECYHNWRFVNGKAPAVCINCGVTKSEECRHEWCFYNKGALMMCRICGLKSPDRQKGCPHSFYYVVTDGSAPFGTKVCKTCGEYF